MKVVLFVILTLGAFSCNSEQEKTVVSDADAKPYTVLDSLSDVIVSAPNNAYNYYRRALYFHDEYEYDQAIADIDRAILIDSTVAEYYNEKGNIYFDSEFFDEAFFSYQKAVELDNELVALFCS